MNNHGYIGGGVVRMISPMIHVNQHGWSIINILEEKPWECYRSVHWWPTMKLLVRRGGWLLQYLNAIMDNNRRTRQGWWCIMNSYYNVSMKSFEGVELSMDDQSWILRGGSYEWQLQCTHEIIWGGWAIPWNTNHEYLSGLVEGLMNGNHNVHPWNHFEWVELSMDVQSWIPWGRGLMNGNYNGSMGNHGYICSTQYLTCR